MQARMTHPVMVLPDAVWDVAADHYDEKELSSLLLSIAAINVWNRLNAAIRQPVPDETGEAVSGGPWITKAHRSRSTGHGLARAGTDGTSVPSPPQKIPPGMSTFG